jgi:hypothetical protein
MGNLLTESVREASRWAYVNATILYNGNDTVTAYVCSLRPCLHTYNSIVKDNQLYEKETRSENMRVDLFGGTTEIPSEFEFGNAGSNLDSDYVAVRYPCRVEGRTFDEEDILPDHIATTTLQFIDFRNEEYTSENVTWPEQCVYQQEAMFVSANAYVMNDDIFDGNCREQDSFFCTKSGSGGFVASAGLNGVLQPMLGSNLTSNVTSTFDSIANAMTNRFRFQYGSARA